MPGRTTKNKTQPKKKLKQPKANRWADILRLDESYTSLILGIIVVFVGLALLISFVRAKHVQQLNQSTSSISIAPTMKVANIPLTITPTPSAGQSATAIPQPTKSITPTKAPSPTVAKQIIKPTSALHQPTTTPKEVPAGKYVVKSGDYLWKIAESYYGSGYNWVDIARANNLSNPGLIYTGQVLTMPQTKPIVVQSQPTTPQAAQNQPNQYGPQITGNTYTVHKGDSLWTIAQRAYNGDGNQWTKIAQANNLTNPSTIYSGNVLTIPRK